MKQVIIMITMSVLMLVGCGGGGNSDSPNMMIPTNSDKFTLHLGNINVDSESNMSSRLTTEFYEGITEVESVSMSKEGTITLEGSDANRFELVGGKVRFKEAATVGTYNVDVKAVKGTKTIVLKRSYEIVQSLKSLMAGKTFYLVGYSPDDGVDFINKMDYNADFNASTGTILEGMNKGLSATGSFTFDIKENKIITETGSMKLASKQEDYLLFTVYPQNSEEGIEGRFYTDEIKAREYYQRLSSTLYATNILENSEVYFAPKIKSFSVTGSKKIENGKVVLGDSFQMYAKFDGILSGDKVVRFALLSTFLVWDGHDLSGDSTLDPEIKLDCQKDAMQKKRYDCQVQMKDRMNDSWKQMDGTVFMDGSALKNIAALSVMSCDGNTSTSPCRTAVIPAVQEVIEVNNSRTVNDGVVYALNTSKDFTVSVWSKPSSVEDNVLISFPSLHHTEFHWALSPSNSHIIEASAGKNNGVLVGGATVANSWKMYTITKQGNETKFYENGVFVKSIIGLVYDLDYVWFALGKHGGSQHNYKGLVDDIIVENIAVSAETITTLYNRTLHTN